MFEEFDKKRQRLLSYMDKVSQYAADNGQGHIAKELQSSRAHLESLRYNIAIMGYMKRGKSTLINALLGRLNDDISPIDVTVCTSAICEYVDMKRDGKERECAEIVFENGQKTPIGLRDIRDYVTEQGNKNNFKKIHKVTVHGDFPLLNNAAVLVDTPGGGSIHSWHDDLLVSFLPMADAIVWLIAANLPLENDEVKFIKLLKNKEKSNIFFVLTKYGELREKGKEEEYRVIKFVEDYIREMGIHFQKLYKTDAKTLYDARRDGLDDEDLIRDRSGIAELEEDIERHIKENSDQNKIIGKRIKLALDCLRNYFEGELKLLDGQLSQFDKDVYTLEADLQKQQREATDLKMKKNKVLRVFEEKWDEAVENFVREIQGKAGPIGDKVENFVDEEGLISKAIKGLGLADKIGKVVQSELQQSALELSKKLEEIVKELHQELSQDVEVYIKKAGLDDISSKTIAIGSLAIAGGAASWGGAAIVATAQPVLAAWSSYASASAVAANAGILSTIQAWLVGSGAAATGPALGTAIQATVSAIVPLVFIPAGLYFGYKILDTFTDKSLKGKIPGLVSEMINKTVEQVKENLTKRKAFVKKSYEDTIEELLSNTEDKRQAIIEAKKSNEPGKKLELEEKKVRLQKLQEEGKIAFDADDLIREGRHG